MKISHPFLAVSLAASLGGLACSESKPAAEAPATAPAATTPAITMAAGGDVEFGVPECEAYVKKYLACLEKVPESARSMVRQSFDQSRAQWKLAASTPEGRAGLATGCQQAEAASKMAMQAYGCQW